MMYAGNVCRVCLTMDAPVRDIAASPLQDVYEKLTEISINTLRQPVAACHLCYAQLRKCQVLMMRSVRANKVLTQIMQGDEIEEQEFVAVIKKYQLDGGLYVTPMELISITGTEYSLINDEMKEERLSTQCRGEMYTDRLPLVERFKFEDSDHVETIHRRALEDMYDNDSGELVNEGNVEMKEERLSTQCRGEMDTDRLPLVERFKFEDSDHVETIHRRALEDMYDNDSGELVNEGNVEMKEERLSTQCRGEMDTDRLPLVERFKFEDSDHVETIHRRALEDMYDNESGELVNEGNVKQEASDGAVDIERQELITKENVNNELEEMEDIYTGAVVLHEESTMQEELEGAQVDEDMKTEGAAPAEECKETHAEKTQDGRVMTSDGNNVLENSLYSDTVINKTNVSVNSDRDCASTNTDVGNSNSKQLKMFVSKDFGSIFDNKCRLIEHHNDIEKEGNRQTRSAKNLFACEGSRRFTKEDYSKSTGENPFECELCKLNFSTKSHLKRHLMTHTGQKPFECEICKLKFSTKSRLKRHLMTRTGQKPFECEICKVRFTQKCSLKIHLMTHTGQKLFECEICKVKFNHKSNLKIHLITHTGEKPFECEMCKARFTQRGSLKIHLMIHTGQKPFECELCKLKFSTKSRLKIHLMAHTGQKPFECEICKVRFTERGSLKTHLMTHTGQKPFECELCKLKFSTNSHIKRHLMTHTGQKPFECDICKLKFSTNSHLKRHLMTHTGQKPFKCEICKVRFTERGSLKRHLMTHTGQKPFECEICKVRFSRKGHLKRHLVTHTGQKRFECEICKVTFYHKGNLKKHLITHTGETL